MTSEIRNTLQIGNSLHHFRKQAGLSQAQVGHKASLRQPTISSLERGEDGVKLRTLFDVLAALNLEMVLRPRTQTSASEMEEIF